MKTHENPVHHDPQYGPYIPGRWVPAPRYVLRRHSVLNHLLKCPVGSVLEVGYGSGALLCDFAMAGFQVTGLDTSSQALSVATDFCREHDEIVLTDCASADWGERFDYLVALEVLEHIEDDVGIMAQWADWVRPGGLLVAAVPAHPWLWGMHDELVGHYRRYTRRSLRAVARNAGLENIRIESYGFPLGITLTVLRHLHSMTRRRSRSAMGCDERTSISGTDRALANRLFRLQKRAPVRLALKMTCAFQGIVKGTPLGDGLILWASKPEHKRGANP